ncbi:rhodanese-like domain-containing protein [Longibaculum muris]|uniref:rhodanese-like domain-containing protein n=1 Tax=Longibaculum muris TaxID=1796628 RepID=UPI001E2F026C|nr:rhodanese-like domain-containing protein [Longibaculum muris]
MNDLKSLKALLAGLFLVGCTNNSIQYQTIDAKKAKEMMATQDVVIVDVREESEYQAGHIPGALLIPLSTINAKNQQLPKSDQILLVYCRSGHRSQKAAQKFVNLGYEHVYDFGGILDWPYEIEK